MRQGEGESGNGGNEKMKLPLRSKINMSIWCDPVKLGVTKLLYDPRCKHPHGVFCSPPTRSGNVPPPETVHPLRSNHHPPYPFPPAQLHRSRSNHHNPTMTSFHNTPLYCLTYNQWRVPTADEWYYLVRPLRFSYLRLRYLPPFRFPKGALLTRSPGPARTSRPQQSRPVRPVLRGGIRDLHRRGGGTPA